MLTLSFSLCSILAILNTTFAALEIKQNILSVYKDKSIVFHNDNRAHKIFYNHRIVCAVQCVNDMNCCGASHNVSNNMCSLYLETSVRCSYLIETGLGNNVLHKDDTRCKYSNCQSFACVFDNCWYDDFNFNCKLRLISIK